MTASVTAPKTVPHVAHIKMRPTIVGINRKSPREVFITLFESTLFEALYGNADDEIDVTRRFAFEFQQTR